MEVNTPPPEQIQSALGGGSVWEASPVPTASSAATDEDSKALLNRSMVSMEHSTVKVPYEILNRKFRSTQKLLEREASTVGACVSEMQTALTGAPTPPTRQLSALLQGVLTQVKSLKRKTFETMSSEMECARVVKRRINHLNEVNEPTVKQAWERKRLDRLLTDYLLREGCYETAKKVVDHRGLDDLTNLTIFQTAYDVEQSLLQHDVTKCLAWCHENKSKLKKQASSLEFNLRIQEYIEMIKRGDRMDAVWHARKFFVTTDKEHLASVQRCMALLAFNTDTIIPEYKSLLSDQRWNKLVMQFREENLRLFQLCPQAAFTVVLQAGLSALKTPQCYKGRQNKDNFNPDCPVCIPSLNELSADLPFAHCSQSRLICNISGDMLNENNQPLMLPNGYVYGTNALEAQAAANCGEVICPRTGASFLLTEAQKVFVM